MQPTQFGETFRRYATPVHSYLTGVGCGATDAGALLGEVAVRLARSLGRQAEYPDEVMWVFSSARAVASSYSPPPTPSTGFTVGAGPAWARQALRALGFADRELVVLIDGLGFSANQVGELTASEPEAVSARLMAAREAMVRGSTVVE